MKPSLLRETDLTNAQFLARHARLGCIGLAGGDTFIDHAIARAQRRLDAAGQWSRWSHAFFFQGVRPDGHHWVIESDLQFHHKHIQLGVQENRASKYHDEKTYTRLAVLDFGLTPAQTQRLLTEALELVATHTQYSIAELLGTLLALRHQRLRAARNLLARDRALFCSALVRHLFQHVGVDLAPGVAVKNTAPEDLARSPQLVKGFELERPQPATLLERLDRKIFSVKTRLRAARKKRSCRS